MLYQRLKEEFCLCWSIVCYGPDPGSEATFHSGHKITVLIWLICFSKGRSALDVQKVTIRLENSKEQFLF